jgi:uncharacterized protein YaeQ
MALTATVRRFEIALSDVDRNVYETLELRAAQHPSESERYLVTRVLARALEHAEGVDFSKGLSENDEPAIWQRDLRGDLQAWIEVGSPTAERLHRAKKGCKRVAVYGWRLDALLRELATATVHKKDELELFSIDQGFIDQVAKTLDKTNRWSLSVTGGALYLEIAGKLYEGACERVAVPGSDHLA